MNNPATEWPGLPQAITSFGATRWEESLYLYGGHFGKAHHYYAEGHSNSLLELDLSRSPREWREIATDVRLQGLAMLAYNGALYRVGGFAARNGVDDEQDLWSCDSFARFVLNDPSAGWTPMSPMPQPRSSHDAFLLGSRLFVVGGWQLAGSRESRWQDTGLVCDLAAENPNWSEFAVPFNRRALAVVARGEEVVVIGGMQQSGDMTTDVSVLHSESLDWSSGPSLPGEPMEGFGVAACVVGETLVVSTASGAVLCLAPQADEWVKVHQLKRSRFFHRLLPVDASTAVAVGGANMEVGKFAEIEAIPLPAL